MPFLAIPFLILAVFIGLRYFGRFSASPSLQSNKVDSNVKIATSFYPLFFFAEYLASPYANIENLTPYGTEPHDYEPTPQQLVQLEKSQLLLINGQGFEPWAQRIIEQLSDQDLLIVETTQELEVAKIDPHVWLSPRLAQVQVATITEALITVDPQHQDHYQAQSLLLSAQLQQLDLEFEQGLSHCQQRSFVTSHAAFGHLAQAYNLEQVAISGLSPDEEPSSRTLAQLSKYVTDQDIKYLFFETLVSPKLTQTLAAETGTQTLVLDPLEGLSQNQIAAGENYFTVMRHNLTNLRLALECQ